MPETKEQSVQTIHVLKSSEKFEAQELAREMAERAKDPLDEAKRPGGFFLRSDGTPVDANGNEIADEDLNADEKKSVATAKRTTKELSEEEAETEKERARLAEAARKVQDKADKANLQRTAAAVEAERARSAAAAGPRRRGR